MASYNRHWLRKWLRFEPHFIIGGEDDPYLYRWYVLPRNHFLNIYLHQFLRSDDDRALHDHPWWFLSWIIKGSYMEHASGTVTLRRRWSLAYRPATWAHRVELFKELAPYDPKRTLQRWWSDAEKPVWTLIVTGPKARTWGFFCPKGWVPWTKFTHDGGCGEYE